MTQKYKPALNGKCLTKKEPFSIQKLGLSEKRKARQNVQTISSIPTKSAKVSIHKDHCYAKPLAPDFHIQVSKLLHKINFLSKKSEAGGNFRHIKN